MKLKILSIFCLFLVNLPVFAASPICDKNLLSQGPCATSKSDSVLPNNLNPLETFMWLESEVRTHQEVYRQKKDLFGNMFRVLENGEGHDKKIEGMVKKEIADTEEDFKSLFQISKSAKILETKLQLCYTQGLCSAYRRVELEEKLAQIQRSKTLLLIKRPLLSHKNFEEFIKKQSQDFVNDDKLPDPKVTKDLIKNSSRETALALLEKVDGIERYLNDPRAPVMNSKNGQYTQEYLNELASKHPMIADDMLDRFELISPPADKQGLLCSLATKRQKDRDRDALIKRGIETSLFVAPFLLGPWGRVGAMGLEGALGTRLLQWGLTAKEIQAGAWVARASVVVATNSLQSMEVSKLGNTCKSIEQKYYLNADAKIFQNMSDCRAEYQDSVFLESLGWITAFAPEIPGPVLKFYKAKFTPQLVETSAVSSQIGSSLKTSPLPKNQWAKEFKTTDQGSFTYMDLSKIERVSDQHMKALPDDYWKFVGNVYSDRLNLTPEEIKGFIKSSQDFSSRTKLIVNTKSAIKEADQFQGGVGIVVSDKTQDLLPFEKALGKTMTRKPGEKSAEIVRLTVSKDADAEKLSKSLINQAAGVILQDPSIKVVYIYTSRIHQRLYSKLGVKTLTSLRPVTEMLLSP